MERERREGHGDSSRRTRGAGRTQRPSAGTSADSIVATCRSRTSLAAPSKSKSKAELQGEQTPEVRRSKRIKEKDYRTQFFEVYEDGEVELVCCAVATSNLSSCIDAFSRKKQLSDRILKNCTNSPGPKIERSKASRPAATAIKRSEDNGRIENASKRGRVDWDLPCWCTTRQRRPHPGQRKLCSKALHLFRKTDVLNQRGPQANSRENRNKFTNGRKGSDGSGRAASEVSEDNEQRRVTRASAARKRAQTVVEMTVVEPKDRSWGASTGVTGMLSLNESLAVASLNGKTTESQEHGVPWFKQVACKNLLEIVEMNARMNNHPTTSALIEDDQAQRLASRKPTAENTAPRHSGKNVTAHSQANLDRTAALFSSAASKNCHCVGLSTDLETPQNLTRDAMEVTCGTGAEESACTTVEVNNPPRRLSAVRSLMRLRANIAEECDQEEEIDLNEFPPKVKRKKHRPKVKRDATRPRKRRGPTINKEKDRSPVNGPQGDEEQCIQFMETSEELQQGHQAIETSSISYEQEHPLQIQSQQGCKERSTTVENISNFHSSLANGITFFDDRAVFNNDGATASGVLSFQRPDKEFTRGAFLQQTSGLNFLWQGHHDTHRDQVRTDGNLVGELCVLETFPSQDNWGNWQGRDWKPFLHDFFAPSRARERRVSTDLNKPPEGHELTLYVPPSDQRAARQSYKRKLPKFLLASTTALPQLTLTQGNSTELTLAQGNAQLSEKSQMVLYNQKKDIVLSRLRKRPKKLRAKVNVDPESLREWHLLEYGEPPREHEDPERKKGWESERAAMASRVDAFIKIMHQVQGDRRFSHWKGSMVDSVVGAFLTQNVSDHLSSSAFMSIASRFPVVPRKDIVDACSTETHERSCGLQQDTKGPSLLMGMPSTVTQEEEYLENGAVNINPQIQDAESTNVECGHCDFMDPFEYAHSSQQLTSQLCDEERNSLMAIEDSHNLSLKTPDLPRLQNKGPGMNVEDGQCDYMYSSESVHSIKLLSAQFCDDKRNSCTVIEDCGNLSLNIPDDPLLKKKGPVIEVEDDRFGFMDLSGSVHSCQQPSSQFCDDERNSHTAVEECNHDCLKTPDPHLLENKGPSTKVQGGNINFMNPSESVHSSQQQSSQFCDDERNSPSAIEDCPHASLNIPNLPLLKNNGPSTQVEDHHCNFLDPFESVHSSQQPSSHFFDDERNSGTDIEDCPHASLNVPVMHLPMNKGPNYMLSDDERNSGTSVEDDLGGVTPRKSWGAFGTRSVVYSRPKVCRKLNFESKAVAVNEEHQIIPVSESCCEPKSAHNHIVEVGSNILIGRQCNSQVQMELLNIPRSGHDLEFQPETVQESSQGSNFQANTAQDTVPFLVPKTGKKRRLSVSSISGIERAQLEANQKGRKKNHHQDWESVRRRILENRSKSTEDSGVQQAEMNKEQDSVNWDAVRLADLGELAETIKERGMHHVLSGRIKAFLTTLYEEHGSIDLEWIRDLLPEKAREYLMSIHGLGVKSVECIRLLTLHHLAFPVDTNVGRICVRLGWVPIEPLPEELQLHLLEMYPVQESIQKYLWPRLCTLKQETLYELHYQLITFGKVFCTKSKPNCNACPMRRSCKHFASAFASAKPLLTGPTEGKIGRICPGPTIEALPAAETHRAEMGLIDYPAYNHKELSFSEEAVRVTEIDVGKTYPLSCCDTTQASDCNKRNFECIIEEPTSPEPAHVEDLMDIEDLGEKEKYIYDKISDYSEELLAETLHCRCLIDQESSLNQDIKSDDNQLSLSTSPPLNVSLSATDPSCCPSQCCNLGEKASCESQMVVTPQIPSMECHHTVFETTSEQPPWCSDMIAEVTSNAIVSLPPESAQIPVPKLKNVGRLRTVHFVYELPDNHPLLEKMGIDAREQDDPCYYLLAIWSPGEIPESQQEIDDLCREGSYTSACESNWGADEKVSGTLLIPCRTAMHGSFPLNGTYFQVNEVFADHESSQHPIQVPRCLIWNLRRRFVYFSTSVPNIFRGLSTSEIRNCFWLGYVCVRGFDRGTRAPKPLVCRLHFPISKQVKTKKREGEEV